VRQEPPRLPQNRLIRQAGAGKKRRRSRYFHSLKTTARAAPRTNAMPSFDIVSEVDKHELTNAVDQAKRDLGNRYDLRGTDARFEHDENVITQFAPSEYQLDQLLDMLRLRLSGRGIDLRSIELGDVETNLAGARRTITIKQGIEQAQAKKIIAKIKEAKLKVDTQITGEKLRINSKKRDDLQTTIAFLRKAELEIPLQFENFRD
jgi:cyclic-di-GMP-binding protein